MSPQRLAVIADVVRGAGPAVRITTELDDALAGVDLVFTTLRVGGLDGRVQDERDALAAGVLGQETVGAGGLTAALRAVPVVDHVASRIAAVAPQAWTISMTNPAGVVTEAMAASLGGRVVGVCDSPAGLVRRACAAVDVDPGPSLADVTGRAAVDYVGLNHLGWLRALTVDGTDRLPVLVVDPQRLATFEEGRLFGPDLIAALGTLPNEYLYWYYAACEAHRAVVDAGRTRGEHVREQQNAFYAAAAAAPERASALWAAANDERNRSYLEELRSAERDHSDIAVGGYESVAVAVAHALTGGAPTELIVNVRNGATVPELPADAVIETVCTIDAQGARPQSGASLNEHELGLMATIKDCERSVIAAARTGSHAQALRAFALHPLVPSVDAARRLVDRAFTRMNSSQT